MIQYLRELLLANLRSFISLIDFWCWFYPSKKSNTLFINRKVGDGSGGPTRFLKQLVDITRQNINLKLENRYPCRAHTALVMGYAWGPWFYHQCKRSNTRTVLRLDGFYVHEQITANHKRQLTRLELYRNKHIRIGLINSDYIIYQSLFSKQQADRRLHNRSDRFSIIPNGVDLSHFKPQTVKKCNRPLTLLVLGKHYTHHIEWAAQVFYHLRKEISANLILVGPPRNRKTSIQNVLRKSLGNNDIIHDITLFGNINYGDLPQVISQGDILLHVKVGDSCPNAVIEAMACGLPVVCPEFGGTSELVENAGISIPGPEWTMSNDMHQAMARALLEIYISLGAYSMYARERATRYFDRELAVSRYLEVLDI